MDHFDSKAVNKKQMSLVVYIGLCFVSFVVGAVFANGVSLIFGHVYSLATVPTVLGFWIGKIVAKNKSRDWRSIVAFPLIILMLALFGTPAGLFLSSDDPGNKPLIALAIVFVIAYILFAFVIRDRSVSK